MAFISLEIEFMRVQEKAKDSIDGMMIDMRIGLLIDLEDVKGCERVLQAPVSKLLEGCVDTCIQVISLAFDVNSCSNTTAELILVVKALGEDFERDIDVVIGDKPWKVCHKPSYFIHCSCRKL